MIGGPGRPPARSFRRAPRLAFPRCASLRRLFQRTPRPAPGAAGTSTPPSARVRSPDERRSARNTGRGALDRPGLGHPAGRDRLRRAAVGGGRCALPRPRRPAAPGRWGGAADERPDPVPELRAAVRGAPAGAAGAAAGLRRRGPPGGRPRHVRPGAHLHRPARRAGRAPDLPPGAARGAARLGRVGRGDPRREPAAPVLLAASAAARGRRERVPGHRAGLPAPARAPERGRLPRGRHAVRALDRLPAFRRDDARATGRGPLDERALALARAAALAGPGADRGGRARLLRLRLRLLAARDQADLPRRERLHLHVEPQAQPRDVERQRRRERAAHPLDVGARAARALAAGARRLARRAGPRRRNQGPSRAAPRARRRLGAGFLRGALLRPARALRAHLRALPLADPALRRGPGRLRDLAPGRAPRAGSAARPGHGVGRPARRPGLGRGPLRLGAQPAVHLRAGR